MEKKHILGVFKSNYLVGASLIYILCSFILKGISFITTPIFTRLMEPADFGIVSAVSTWVTFVAIFICSQVSGSVAAARVHKSKDEFEAFVGNITLYGMIHAAIVGGIMIGLRNWLGPLMGIQPSLVNHVVIQAYGTALISLYTSYLIQTKHPQKYLIFTVATTAAIISLGLFWVYSLQNNRYLGRIWATTIVDSLIIIIVLIRFLTKVKLDKRVLFADWRFALTLGLPLIFHLVATTILGQSDRLFILHMNGESDAGIYTVAYSIGLLGMIFANACNDAWSPWYLENTKAQNNEAIRKRAEIYIAFIALCFFEVFMVAPEILEIMAPEPYWKAKSTVLFIILGVFFQFLYRFPQAYETYCMNLKWTAVATTIAAALNCLLNYFFIRAWGIDGAAIATLISYIVLFLFHEVVARCIIGGFNIPIRIYVLPILACFVAFILAFTLLELRWVRLSIMLGIAIIVLISLLHVKKNNALLRRFF